MVTARQRYRSNKHKKRNTIRYTWGIHSLTRKRMKTHTKKRRRSSKKKRNSRRRRRIRGRKSKGGTPATVSPRTTGSPTTRLQQVRQNARRHQEALAIERAERRRRSTTGPVWQCSGCVRVEPN